MAWSGAIPVITSVGGIFAGWCLAEVGQKLHQGRQDSRALNRAIVDLLRARDLTIVSANDLAYEAEWRGGEAVGGERSVFSEAAQLELASTIDRISEIDPVLGYKLHFERTRCAGVEGVLRSGWPKPDNATERAAITKVLLIVAALQHSLAASLGEAAIQVARKANRKLAMRIAKSLATDEAFYVSPQRLIEIIKTSVHPSVSAADLFNRLARAYPYLSKEKEALEWLKKHSH